MNELMTELRHATSPFFFYPGGGFVVERASFELAPVQDRPAAELKDPHAQPLAARQAAFDRCPWQVRIQVDGRRLVLDQVDSVRFLDRVGLLRRCSACGTEQLIFEVDTSICQGCGYRST
jgi:hypothetical protein